jgi:hypothetical protein
MNQEIKTFDKKRIEICKACNQYRLGMCMQCGCYMGLKTKLRDAQCPIGKWHKEL